MQLSVSSFCPHVSYCRDIPDVILEAKTQFGGKKLEIPIFFK
jgi:hypothetical protein